MEFPSKMENKWQQSSTINDNINDKSSFQYIHKIYNLLRVYVSFDYYNMKAFQIADNKSCKQYVCLSLKTSYKA